MIKNVLQRLGVSPEEMARVMKERKKNKRAYNKKKVALVTDKDEMISKWMWI